MPVSGLSLSAMNRLTAYADFHHHGADLLADIHSTTHEQLLDLGFPTKEATSLKSLAAFYHGPCRTPALQRKAVAAARVNHHSLATLRMIRTMATKRLDGGRPFELIHEFCQLTGTYDDIERHARRLEHLNQQVPDRKHKAHGKRRATTSTRPTPDGLKTLHLTGPADDIDRLAHLLKPGIRRRMAKNRRLLKSQATYDELLHHIFGPARSATPVKNYNIIVPISLNDYHRVLDGHGDDVRVACSDGQILTGTELINAKLADDLYIGLVHPVTGPTNLYRTKRLANRKQRILAKADNPLCPAPDCTTAADDCQIHHLTSWARGGHTNLTDLASVCAADNARNDDDPAHPRRGRFARINGKIHWVTPDGTAHRNTHPAAQMGLMDLA